MATFTFEAPFRARPCRCLYHVEQVMMHPRYSVTCMTVLVHAML